jgi:hypothetical protein
LLPAITSKVLTKYSENWFELERPMSTRGKVRRNNVIIRFTGTITGVEMNYGFIKRDEIGDVIYFYRYHDNYDNWEVFKKNVKVNFILSFNYRGQLL